VQRAAFLAVMCEDFEVRYTLGEPIELADYAEPVATMTTTADTANQAEEGAE
jgi:hypothetical protein